MEDIQLKIALCTSLKDATTVGLKDPNYCKQFVGALWIPEFCRLAKEAGHEIIAGRDLLTCRNISDYHVIQEDRSPIGRKLVKLRANPLVNFCLESPMYVPSWYDQLESGYSKKFEQILGFHNGITFPSFQSEDHPSQHQFPWNLRHPLVMVASNKYFRYTSPSRLHRKLLRSQAWKHAIENQLQDKRYEALKILIAAGLLDLYGHGWPPDYAKSVANKIQTISRYKFAVCFENVSSPGYMTEKIIDCFVAGVIPIYLGDPTIENRIPKGTYIDFRHFQDWNDLVSWLSMVNEDMAHEMIHRAAKWLRSKDGLDWSYKGFAQKILGLCLGKTQASTSKSSENSIVPPFIEPQKSS